jgi:hypothetical protein
MKTRLFTDSIVPPTDALLRKQLGKAFQIYQAILQVSAGYRRQWQFSRGNGWLLKVDDTRKALYYLIAFEDGIEISLTVRDAERQRFLNKPNYEYLQTQLAAATKYSEGYALRFGMERLADCEPVARFISELIEIRGTPSVPKKRTRRSKADEIEKASKKKSKI